MVKGISKENLTKENGDEKNIPAFGGIAAVGQRGFGGHNYAEVDRRLAVSRRTTELPGEQCQVVRQSDGEDIVGHLHFGRCSTQQALSSRSGISCTTFPKAFGQFPVDDRSGDDCDSWDWQGVSKTQAYVAFGVVTTDIHGDGSFSVAVGLIASGTYHLEFVALDGAGCFLTGGGSDCTPDFQSPGPKYGDTTTITIP